VRTDAADMLKRRLKQAGLPAHYSPHSFRATGITNFLENDGTLKPLREVTAELPVGQDAPTDLGKAIESRLEKISGFLDRLQAVGEKSAELAAKIGAFAAKYGTLILGARHLPSV